MTIERLTTQDWLRLRTIRLLALQEAPDAFARTYAEESAFPPKDWRARLSGEAATFVAVIDAADAGLATGAPWRGRDGVAGLFGMWVAPEARGRGVGRALVAAVVDWSRTGGFERLVLNVADDNRAAIGLYTRAGFEPTGATATLPPPRENITEHERALVL